jgi:NAD(P)-dependent dehydrogenase (short-subunit alcohol dehydrogenase family)
MNRDVLVVIGTGGMGVAIARRCGSGRRVVLADVGAETLDLAASALEAEGHHITAQRVDVTDRASVDELAATASSLGPVRAVAHTAGVSPVQAPADLVLAVDLVGAAHVLDAFSGVIAPGGAAVVISSMAGHLVPPLAADVESEIVAARPDELATLAAARDAAVDAGIAYAFAKAAVAVRVRAAAKAWGRVGARLNSISPGVIATPMGHMELAGASGELMRQMVASSATARLGTPDDIAAATEFLLSSRASFVTGTDLLVDGGAVAAVRSGQLGASS